MKIHTHTPKGHGMLEMCLPLSRQAQLQRERDTDGAKRGCVLESRGGGGWRATPSKTLTEEWDQLRRWRRGNS